MVQLVADLLDKVEKIEHGFKHIIEAGDIILKNKEINFLDLSTSLLGNESYQSRMLATYLLGQLSTTCPEALRILETTVATDANWRVQEMLAKAFDTYCQQKGYKESLPKVKEWLGNRNPNIRRAVIEGLRIWTSRDYFRDHPAVAVQLISMHHADESEYLRKSVGNALHDIYKKFPELVRVEINTWDLNNIHAVNTKQRVVR